MDDDDRQLTLGEIADRHGKSIVSLMIDIQERKIPNTKLREFIENLECFYRGERTFPISLLRQNINANEEHDYVALSYTWTPSPYEDPRSGSYGVQRRDGNGFHPSPVRDCVFDRILKYMEYYAVDLLWIDRNSMKQRCCKDPLCYHYSCQDKRDSLEAMDIVYRLSNHPVGLLARPFTSSDDLEWLYKLLAGELTKRDSTPEEDKNTLRVLQEITSDAWWDRGWIYQEQYFSGKAMHLLIPSSLKPPKQCHTDLFGDIDGELCINFVKFSEQATLLCLKFLRKYPEQARDIIDTILSKVKRYTVVLGKHESMSPSIISDIWSRSFNGPFDSLAITANCCQYSRWFDIEDLKNRGQSLSLSMLTMCFLNGEIFRNANTGNPLSRMTASQFLHKQSFKGYPAESLSFKKGCRLVNPWITWEGLRTRGYLWKLGKRFTVTKRRHWGGYGVGQLSDLADKFGNSILAQELRKYIKERKRVGRGHMRMMSDKIIDAINDGNSLRPGVLWDPVKKSSFRAIFISNTKPGQSQNTDTDYIFTASCPGTQWLDDYDINDLDRHVSMGVQFPENYIRGIPQLYVQNWVFGLCFFRGCRVKEVVFPWPQELKNITPGRF